MNSTPQDKIDRPYSGELATKIEGLKMPSLLGQFLIENYEPGKASAHIPVAWVAKLGLLLEHFGIEKSDPERWFFLSFYLAIKHVPGFEIDQSEPAGAKKVWDAKLLAQLYVEVNDLLAERRKVDSKFSESSACAILEKRTPWSTLSRSQKSGTLRRRYQDAKNSLYVKMASGIEAALAERSRSAQSSINADTVLRALAGLTPMDQTFDLLHGVISNGK